MHRRSTHLSPYLVLPSTTSDSASGATSHSNNPTQSKVVPPATKKSQLIQPKPRYLSTFSKLMGSIMPAPPAVKLKNEAEPFTNIFVPFGEPLLRAKPSVPSQGEDEGIKSFISFMDNYTAQKKTQNNLFTPLAYHNESLDGYVAITLKSIQASQESKAEPNLVTSKYIPPHVRPEPVNKPVPKKTYPAPRKFQFSTKEVKQGGPDSTHIVPHWMFFVKSETPIPSGSELSACLIDR